ncbi:hypothetical protein K3181_10410 [Qipengyuania sp. YG27]|uniref:Uncharacterized protein n=1 Tax=Qipengyuania mesophila TaxID=2867246 RepID=A0ABS7JWA1_9SPHN|nr:hypothetical protein [Qipengyuania mesophila]MBX7501853.1 hypothetical protein [Qipengyuania mesophila]
MLRKFAIGAACAVAVLSTAAIASVTFDPATGTGFVGKGDVQLAFGWNNAAAQANANGVTFSYKTETTYDVTCEWDTVAGKSGNVVHHEITVPKNSSVLSGVAYDARKSNQYTGYNLTGLGASTTSGQTAPDLGAACPGNNPGVVTAVDLISETGGLFVTFNGTSKEL